MKIEEMYCNMQERYKEEQEKQFLKLAAEKAEREKQEKEAKGELKNILTTILEVTKNAIESIPNDMLYQFYVEAKKTSNTNRKRKEDIVKLLCYSESNSISFTLCFNGREFPILGKHFDFDRNSYIQLYKLLSKAYRGITFGAYNDTVIFSFNEGTITLEFSLNFRKIYATDDEEKIKEETTKSTKRLIADIKEIFPDARTSRHGYQRDILYVTIKLY